MTIKNPPLHRGIVLVSVFIIACILLVMCVSLITAADTETTVAENNLLQTQCYFMALTGLEEGLERVRKDPMYVSTEYADAETWRPSQTGGESPGEETFGKETEQFEAKEFGLTARYGFVVLDEKEPNGEDGEDGYADTILCTARMGRYDADGAWLTSAVVSLQAQIDGLVTGDAITPFARTLSLADVKEFDDTRPHLYVW